jgi:hypothetical protein
MDWVDNYLLHSGPTTRGLGLLSLGWAGLQLGPPGSRGANRKPFLGVFFLGRPEREGRHLGRASSAAYTDWMDCAQNEKVSE